MVRRHNALLVSFYVVADAICESAAFLLAFVIRFESGLLPVTKGLPPIEQYVGMLPFVAALTPLAFQLHVLTATALFALHRNPDSGSPLVAGSTSRFNAGNNSG